MYCLVRERMFECAGGALFWPNKETIVNKERVDRVRSYYQAWLNVCECPDVIFSLMTWCLYLKSFLKSAENVFLSRKLVYFRVTCESGSIVYASLSLKKKKLSVQA